MHCDKEVICISEIYMTLDGVPSKEVGLHVKTHRAVFPARYESIFEVSGRDGYYDYDNNPYIDRIITVDFFVKDNAFPTFREHIRAVADWLSKKGKITFSDDPPGRYYEGATYGQVDLDQAIVPSGRFSASFKCQPFQYGRAQEFESIGSTPVMVPIDYEGSQGNGCRIIIQNTGSTSIRDLLLTLTSRR